MSPTITAAERRSSLRVVLRVSSGNFLEQYDFFVYGYYASYIRRAFFPNSSPAACLILSQVSGCDVCKKRSL